MTQPLRIGIAGLGTVGAGTVKLLQEHRDAAGAALRPADQGHGGIGARAQARPRRRPLAAVDGTTIR